MTRSATQNQQSARSQHDHKVTIGEDESETKLTSERAFNLNTDVNCLYLITDGKLRIECERSAIPQLSRRDGTP